MNDVDQPIDQELTLVFGQQTAVVAPSGASLRSYRVGDWDVIWAYSGTENKKGGQGDVLIPFPSRTRYGKYTFEGIQYQMPLNDKDGPNSIHGFLRGEKWQIEDHSSTEAHFLFEMRTEVFESYGYPFSLDVRVSYVLGEGGLTTSFEIKNVGARAAPVGAGFHPYFQLPKGALSSWEAVIPASKCVILENLVPTGDVRPVDGTSLDFRRGRTIREEVFNHTLAALERGSDGYAKIVLRSPENQRSIELSLNRSFDYVVVYTGDQIAAPNTRRALAIEPLTCGTDALNHPEWGLRILNTGQNFAGSYRIATT